MVPDPPLRPDPDGSDGPGDSRTSYWVALLVLVMVGAAVLPSLITRFSEERAIRRLPSAERQALFESTLRESEIRCAPGAPPSFEDSCADVSRRLLAFPECDAACRHQARKALPPPRR